MPPTVKSVDEALQRDHLYIKVVEVHFPGFFFLFYKGRNGDDDDDHDNKNPDKNQSVYKPVITTI